MNRFPFLVCLAFLLLLVQAEIVSAASTETTTTTPERTGGYIYFETSPPGATIWLDTIKIGTSPFTYYTEKTGTMEVRVQKRLFEDYTGTVTVSDGERVVFHAMLTPVPSDMPGEDPPAVIVTTVPIIEKNTAIPVPTPWPSSTPESPVDPAVVIGAAAGGIGFFVIRRR